MRTFKIILLAIAACLIGSGNGQAAEHPAAATATSPPASAAIAATVTVTGENICLGCTLKRAGAAAQCKDYGHRHALRLDKAGAKAAGFPGQEGVVLNYLDTDSSQPYITGHHGETLTLAGKVYTDLRVLELPTDSTLKKAAKSEHPEHPTKGEHPEHPR